MTNIELLLATERFQRTVRDGRVRDDVLSRLRRWSLAPAHRPCCPPPCCFRCWAAI